MGTLTAGMLPNRWRWLKSMMKCSQIGDGGLLTMECSQIGDSLLIGDGWITFGYRRRWGFLTCLSAMVAYWQQFSTTTVRFLKNLSAMVCNGDGGVTFGYRRRWAFSQIYRRWLASVMVGFIDDDGFGFKQRATMKTACDDEDDDEVILCVSEFWVWNDFVVFVI